MAVTTEQELEIRRLLASSASERDIADAVGTTRRQVQNIKKTLPKQVEDHPCSVPAPGGRLRRADTIKTLVRLSTRPGGVRYGEMWPTLRELFGMRTNDKTGTLELGMTDNQLRYLKKKTTEAAEAQGKEALFIPDWLPRHSPEAANDMLVSLAGFLHDRAQEYVSDYSSCFPDASSKHALRELVCLAFTQATAEPIEVRCRRNREIAHALQRSVGSIAAKPAANDPVLVDAELDKLCI